VSTVKGNLKPLGKKIFVNNMDFGEQVLASGIVLTSDDGKDRGIHPRWGQVWAVGPDHDEDFNVGDWILIEHGRWSRGIKYEYDDGRQTTIRLVDNECIIMWNEEKPNDVIIGTLTGGEAPPTISPDEFLR
jgi:co-chaperonin GroES (HSP10)